MSHLLAKFRRPMARVYLGLVVAAVAGSAFVLGVSAALDATWDPRGAVVLALAAVWIPQALIAANRRRRP